MQVSLNIDRPAPKDPKPRLTVSHLSVRDPAGVQVLKDVSFTVNSGEVLGIAGISGCGQKELLEAIAGLQSAEIGSSVQYLEDDGSADELLGLVPPEDPRRRAWRCPSYRRTGSAWVWWAAWICPPTCCCAPITRARGPFVNRKSSLKLAQEVVDQLGVVTPDVFTSVRKLSGGNVQKILVGREIAAAPSVLMTAYAVRGLDINTSYAIYDLINQQKEKGVRRHLRRRGSGRAAGAVRPHSGAVFRSGERHSGRPRRNERAGRPAHDQSSGEGRG